MRSKVLLVLIVFIISTFMVSCENNTKLDVKGYREGLKKSQKKSMPIEKKKQIEKSIFPNLDNEK